MSHKSSEKKCDDRLFKKKKQSAWSFLSKITPPSVNVERVQNNAAGRQANTMLTVIRIRKRNRKDTIYKKRLMRLNFQKPCNSGYCHFVTFGDEVD